MGIEFLTKAEKERKERYNAICNLYRSLRKKADDSGEEVSENRVINAMTGRLGMSNAGIRKILISENVIKQNDNVGRPRRN